MRIKSKALKKVVFSLIMGVSAVALIISCRHQLPGGTDAGSGAGGGGINPVPAASCSPDTAYFRQQVLPIFISNCAMSGCHDPASHQDGVVLSTYSNIIQTGHITPGNPGNSKVYRMITDPDNNDRMPPPPRPRLSQLQIDVIRKWIQQGAKDNSCVEAGCDTTNVTYSGAIRNIISNKCQGCHSGSAAGGGYDYTTYAGVKARANDGKLWGAVNQMPGYSPMPKNGARLSDCELAQIKKWIDAGAPNN
jgi:ribosomal protein S16